MWQPVSTYCQYALPTSTQCNTQNTTSNMKYQKSQLFWYPRCCFLSPTSQQPLFTATAVYCLVSLHVCQNTKTIISQNLNFYAIWPLPADPFKLLPKMPNCQHTAVHFYLLLSHRNVLITLLDWVTNYECWIVAEWNSRCRFGLVFEIVYWREISISMIIASNIISKIES